MGSNQNRFGDKKAGGGHEWGSKDRKEAHAQRHTSLNRFAIEDQINPKPTPRQNQHKKDTVQWCRGKEGQEHNYRVHKRYNVLSMQVTVEKCFNCGRQRFQSDWG